jgi:hypothetical protein
VSKDDKNKFKNVPGSVIGKIEQRVHDREKRVKGSTDRIRRTRITENIKTLLFHRETGEPSVERDYKIGRGLRHWRELMKIFGGEDK